MGMVRDLNRCLLQADDLFLRFYPRYLIASAMYRLGKTGQ
jgi:hypothetical protein